MKKYTLIFKTHFLSFLQYRAALLVGFVTKLGMFIAFVFIWRRIYRQGGDLGEYTLSSVIFYYLFVEVLDGFYSSRVAGAVQDHILSGQLSAKLIKPIRMGFYYFMLHTARVLSESGFYIAFSVPILLFSRKVSSSLSLTFVSILQFFLVAILAILLGFNIFFMGGLVTFWIKQSGGIHMIMKNIGRFFNGGLIPLDLLPISFQNFVFLLPYPYIIYFPIKILMGSVELGEFKKAVVVMLFWVIILVLVNLLFWKKGIKKYESVGI